MRSGKAGAKVQSTSGEGILTILQDISYIPPVVLPLIYIRHDPLDDVLHGNPPLCSRAHTVLNA